MPDEGSGEKTEDATPRRLQRMREEGKVAKSRDFASAIIVLLAVLLLKFTGGFMLDNLQALSYKTFTEWMPFAHIPSGEYMHSLTLEWVGWFLYILAPFLIGMVIFSAGANLIQVGFLYTTKPMEPDLNKLNPISGFQRMFALRSWVMLIMNTSKLAIVFTIAFVDMASYIPGAIGIIGLEIPVLVAYGGEAVFSLALHIAILLMILGIMDYAYQKWQFAKETKMSKQEVKEEFKSDDGDPQIKARRRQLHRQMAMQRMMSEVPSAEVVVRNPTHFAVAIRYKPEDLLPKVVAKGMNKVALRIVEQAIKSNVPVWSDPPLARKLYQAVEVGDTIPPELFEAVALLMSHVLTGDKRAAYLNRQGA